MLKIQYNQFVSASGNFDNGNDIAAIVSPEINLLGFISVFIMNWSLKKKNISKVDLILIFLSDNTQSNYLHALDARTQ